MAKRPPLNWQLLSIFSILSGLIYNSWPLGYLLNPYVARHDLASELEALRQPFNWVFVGGDIMSGVLLIFVAAVLYRKIQSYNKVALITLALASAVAFGIGTIVDAMIPLNCDPTVQRCPSYIHSPLILTHGLFSILASVCLFLTMAIFWWLDRRSRLMNAIVAGYILFGIFSIISIVLPGQDSWAQHYSLLLDGVCIAIIPFITAELIRKQAPD